MRKLPVFESTTPNDLLTTVTYLGKEYPAVKIDIKAKVKEGQEEKMDGKDEVIHAIFGSEAMYDVMIDDENQKLKGEEAVKLDGTLSGYLNITVDSSVEDIIKEVEASVGDWAEIVTKIDEAKISDGIRRFDRHESMDGDTLKEIMNIIDNLSMDERGPISNGSLLNYLYGLFDGYDYSKKDNFKKALKSLKDSDLRKRISDVYDKVKEYPVTTGGNAYEGLFDRVLAKGRGVVAGAKASVNNKVQGVVNKVKAVGQAVSGLRKGDLSQAQSTLQNAPKAADPKQVAVKNKALSIINSMYDDLSALFPGKDVVNPLKTLYATITESKEVTLKASDYELGDKITYKFSDPKINKGKEQVRTGTVEDHFGDGIMIKLDKPIKYFSTEKHNKNSANYNYQDGSSEIDVDFFELYDGEDNEYGSFKNLSKHTATNETLVTETWERMDKLADLFGEGEQGWSELLDDLCRKSSDDKINEALDYIARTHEIDLSSVEDDVNEAHGETWDKLEVIKDALGGPKATMEAMVRAMDDDYVNRMFDLMEKEFVSDDVDESKIKNPAAKKAYDWYLKYQKAADKCKGRSGKAGYQQMADKFLKEYEELQKNTNEGKAANTTKMKANWYGVDASKEESLHEYGLLINDKGNDNYDVIYKASTGDDPFSRTYMTGKEITDIIDESWVEKEEFLSFLGTDEEAWKKTSTIDKLSDLISYYGVQNIISAGLGSLTKEEAEEIVGISEPARKDKPKSAEEAKNVAGKHKYKVSFKIVDLADDGEPWKDLVGTIDLEAGVISNIKYDDNTEFYSADAKSDETDTEKLGDKLFDQLAMKIDSVAGMSVENFTIETAKGE